MRSKDFSVSGEDFTIVTCQGCGFHFTNPVPDEATIGKYYKSENYVSHSSSKKGFINRIYHLVRWYSLKRKVSLLNKLVKGRELLDIGAGTAHFLAEARKGGWNIAGLEPDENARKLAKSLNNVDLDNTSTLHSMPDKRFDVITMWHVLEHVYHLKKDAEKIVSLLSKDGVLIVAVPNMNSYDAKYYKEFWAAFDLPIHLYHFTRVDIENLFGQFDMEIKEVKPMIFDSFYVSMLSEKYKNGNMFRGVLIGLKSNWRAKEGFCSSQIYVLKKKNALERL